MKSYSEMARNVIERRNQYDRKKKRRKRHLKVLSFVILLCVFIMGVWGYHGSKTAVVNAANLLEGIHPTQVTPLKNLRYVYNPLTEFSLRLFQKEGEKGGNVLISPLSAVYSLGMMVNGANASTREQMESALGMKTDELNLALYSLQAALSQDDGGHLIQANSIWFSRAGRFHVSEDFLQTCADYYEADLIQIPFDENMVREVNEWVAKQTNQVMPKIMDEAPEDAIASVINAMSFEAKWLDDDPLDKVYYGKFLMENGETKIVTYFSFLEDNFIYGNLETGFVKYFQADSGRQYAFVVLLPRREVSMEDYLAQLSGEQFRALINNAGWSCIDHPIVSIPRFTVAYESDLSESLKAMGMTEAFDAKRADFSLLGSMEKGGKTVPYIGRFLQKTMLSIDEKGTMARAASATIMETEEDFETKNGRASFSRPFIYAIVERETLFPLFLGICNEPETK